MRGTFSDIVLPVHRFMTCLHEQPTPMIEAAPAAPRVASFARGVACIGWGRGQA